MEAPGVGALGGLLAEAAGAAGGGAGAGGAGGGGGGGGGAGGDGAGAGGAGGGRRPFLRRGDAQRRARPPLYRKSRGPADLENTPPGRAFRGGGEGRGGARAGGAPVPMALPSPPTPSPPRAEAAAEPPAAGAGAGTWPAAELAPPPAGEGRPLEADSQLVPPPPGAGAPEGGVEEAGGARRLWDLGQASPYLAAFLLEEEGEGGVGPANAGELSPPAAPSPGQGAAGAPSPGGGVGQSTPRTQQRHWAAQKAEELEELEEFEDLERQILEQELSESTGAAGAAAGQDSGPPSVSKPPPAPREEAGEEEDGPGGPLDDGGGASSLTAAMVETRLVPPAEPIGPQPTLPKSPPDAAELGERAELRPAGGGAERRAPEAADLHLADEGPPSRGVDKALLMASFQRHAQPAAGAGAGAGAGAEYDAATVCSEDSSVKATSAFVHHLFYEKPKQPPPSILRERPAAKPLGGGAKGRGPGGSAASKQHELERALAERVGELDREAAQVREERQRLAKLRSDVEARQTRLQEAELVHQRQVAADRAALAEARERDERRARKETHELEMKRRALLHLPSKKERDDLQALRDALAAEREAAKAKDRSHRMNEDRLRRQMGALQDEVGELRGEVQRLEGERLAAWDRQCDGAPGGGETTRLADSLGARGAGAPGGVLLPGPGGVPDDALVRSSLEGPPPEAAVAWGAARREEEDLGLPSSSPALRDAARGGAPALPSPGARSEAASGTAGASPPPGAALAAAAGAGGEGRRERRLPDGTRRVQYANGTQKQTLPDKTTTVWFNNGDLKRTRAGGKVEYFYAEVDTWHVTHADGLEVYYFASGQAEAHFPDGAKEILFADGVARRVGAPGAPGAPAPPAEADADPAALSRALRAPPPYLDPRPPPLP